MSLFATESKIQKRLEKETIFENISSDQIPVKALSIVNILNKKEKK